MIAHTFTFRQTLHSSASSAPSFSDVEPQLHLKDMYICVLAVFNTWTM